jgi:GTP-binding protein EngB required for normal cell division
LKGKAKALTEGAALTRRKKSEKSILSKEAREELEERKEKIKQMELVLDMRHEKEKDKQKVIWEFLSNMVDPLFPFQN